MENPWQVNSIEAFAYLKCPECDFDSKAESSFKNHAVKTHPLSQVFFGKASVDNDTKVTILKYDPNGIDNHIQENYEELEFDTESVIGIDMVKDEITIDDHDFSEIVVETNGSKFEEQKDGTEVAMSCNEPFEQSAHNSQDNKINEDPISISNMMAQS